ncbi:MAG: glycosyltransferase family 2 protein [Pseudomonadota bacterium]
MRKHQISVIIPALNEAKAIAGVIKRIPAFVHEVIVADNGSTDETASIARAAGAKVIAAPERGYGNACLAGVAAASKNTTIFVFLDGDGSDTPEALDTLVRPIIQKEADLVIGSRALGTAQAGALTLPQRFGNWLACFLMKRIWNATYTDLGPFRAITREGYEALDMQAPTYGWTVEMQVRAVKQGLKTKDVPMDYFRRVGKSKISGTVRGVVLAGVYILGTIFVEAFKPSKTDHSRPDLQGTQNDPDAQPEAYQGHRAA